MLISPHKYNFILNKDNKYFKLFKLLYEENQKNRKKNIKKRIDKNNCNILDEKEIYDENKKIKPITIEHYINGDKSFINNNSELTRSKSYRNLSNINDFHYLDNNIFDIDLNPLKNKYSYKKIFNFKKYDQKFFLNYFNSSLNYKDILFDSFKKNNNNKNDLNLCLITKRQKHNINNNIKNNNKDILKRNMSSNELKNKKKSLNLFKKTSFPEFIYNKSFKNNINFNDMMQINRFRHCRKELSEERIKINNMMAEFFKNPLFNKYNHKEIILDIYKQKNLLTRPKSALS